jgi:hypothetical protein
MFRQVLVEQAHQGKEIPVFLGLVVQNMVEAEVVLVVLVLEVLVDQEHPMFMHMAQQIQ